MAAASWPAAPARFSSTTGCAQRAVNLGPRARARISLGLPAAPVSRRMGLLGYAGVGAACLVCAEAGVTAHAAHVEIAVAKASVRAGRVKRPRARAASVLTAQCSRLTVHRINGGFAGKMRAKIRQQFPPAFLAYLPGGGPDVRGEHDAVHGDQLGRHSRLVPEYVEAGAGDPLLAERRNESRLINDGAARDIDEKALRSQGVEDACVN